MPHVAVFDLDLTLIKADSSTSWCQYLAQHQLVDDPEGFVARERELMDCYDAGTMKVEDYIAFTSQAVAHYDMAKLNQLLDEYVSTSIKPLIYPQGVELIEKKRAEGALCIVISASADYIVRRVCAQLPPLDGVVAVQVAVKDNHLSSEIIGKPPFKAGKVTALENFIDAHGLHGATVEFYTDSINDLPLCLKADKVTAVNPGTLLRQEAQKRGWPILDWS